MQKIESVQTMWILIISLVLLGIIALIAGYIRNKRLQQKIEKGELDRMPEVKEAGWALIAYTYDLHHQEEMNEGNIMTEYEQKFSEKGNPINKLIAQRK